MISTRGELCAASSAFSKLKAELAGGTPITYDAIGNPLTDGTWTYTWQHGRQLVGMEKDGRSISYTYNADGKRISKTVDGITYNYHYLGERLVEMTWGSNRMRFSYDAIGAMSVSYNGTDYFYLRKWFSLSRNAN